MNRLNPGQIVAIITPTAYQGDVVKMARVRRDGGGCVVTDVGPFPRYGADKTGAYIRVPDKADWIASIIYARCLSAKVFVPNTFNLVPKTIKDALAAIKYARSVLDELEKAIEKVQVAAENETTEGFLRTMREDDATDHP